MIIFLFAVLALILGYIIYGKIVENIFGIDEKNITPAIAKCDNVDYLILPNWRIFLIQFLNIAGLGPVFGAILGALYGPVCLFWIVLGSIFAGGVHDYMVGMISLRNNGNSLSYLIEKYMGSRIQKFFLLFMILLLLLVGTVFAMSPAQMLANLSHIDFIWWIVAIFSYYFLATLLPIDKIIGKIYPLFALLLIGVSIAIIVVLFISKTNFYPDLTTINLHPQNQPIFPLMFITIACGAISGFHATQSPMMARCISNEKYGRRIFYGAMITEGIVALIWATLGIAFYHDTPTLNQAVSQSGPGGVVFEIANGYLGKTGGIFAVLSVITLSVTSGDTAFRSARLAIGDYFTKHSPSFKKRLLISIAVLAAGISLSLFDLTAIWMYFGCANQLLATITLWMATFYLYKENKRYWITLLPAGFMVAVCTTYILHDKIGFRLPFDISTGIGVLTAVVLVLWFIIKKRK